MVFLLLRHVAEVRKKQQRREQRAHGTPQAAELARLRAQVEQLEAAAAAAAKAREDDASSNPFGAGREDAAQDKLVHF